MDMHLFRLNFWISVTDCAKSYPYNVFQTIKHQLKHHFWAHFNIVTYLLLTYWNNLHHHAS